MEKVNHVYLSLGSNIENRLDHLKLAIQKIEDSIGSVLKKSSIYESEALGFISEISFYNMCIEIETNLSPEKLLKKTQEIEVEIGRKTKTTDQYTSRKIDIDIILYGNLTIETASLSIPHKKFSERKFVLLPLQEIFSTYLNVNQHIKITDLVNNCTDNSIVNRVNLSL